MKPPDADISGLIALVVGVCGLVVLLISTTAVMTRIYRRRLSRQVAEVSTISGLLVCQFDGMMKIELGGIPYSDSAFYFEFRIMGEHFRISHY